MMKFINWLNRTIIVIACLVLMVVLTILFVFPHVVLEGVGRWMVDWGVYLGRQDPWTRLGIGIALAVVVDVVLLILIFLEVRRHRGRYLRVQQVAGGMATISVESVTELLHHRLDPLLGVISVKPQIQAKGNKVDARVEVGVSRGTNVPETASLLIRTIQSVLTDELGMQIAGQPEVQVTVLTPDEGTAAPTPPPVPFGGDARRNHGPDVTPAFREGVVNEATEAENTAPAQGDDEA
jgi:hypothetical protein